MQRLAKEAQTSFVAALNDLTKQTKLTKFRQFQLTVLNLTEQFRLGV